MTLSRAELVAWIASAVGVLGSAIGWIVAPAQFPHAWLAALTCWVGWPLGSIALILIHALTGGRWGRAIRPQLVIGATTLPLLLPALVPLIFVLPALYPWMQADVAAHLDNRFYLNPQFFAGRGIAYLVVWLGLAALVLGTLRHEDPESILYRIAPPGLILLALTVTFAAIDYTLSMEPQFKSSVYGLLVGSEAVLLALSFAVAAAALVQPPDRSKTMEDLGKLMLGLLVFWAYLDFMQLLIIWQSDLPHEADWYVRRTTGTWAVVAAVIAGLHFFLPFFVLLWPQFQRSRRAMGWVAALLVIIEIPRAWWIVIPASGRTLSPIDLAAMLAVFGVAAAIALRARRLIPHTIFTVADYG